MKLVLAVVAKQDADTLASELSSKKIGATRLKSTGGFLRQGNTTFLIGVEDHRLSSTMALIRKTCGTRVEMTPPVMPSEFMPAGMTEQPSEIVSGGATIWVLPMKEFQKL
jgi:uncharacterized protein YaaQ